MTVEKKAPVAVLLRSLWISGDGPGLQQLAQAVRGQADLFNLPPFETFETRSR